MLVGFTLALAILGVLLGLAALLVALFSVGKTAQYATKVDALNVDVASLQGHRARLDRNVAMLAQRSGLPDGVIVVAEEPARPQ